MNEEKKNVFQEKLKDLLEEYKASLIYEEGNGIFVQAEIGDFSFYFKQADEIGFDV